MNIFKSFLSDSSSASAAESPSKVRRGLVLPLRVKGWWGEGSEVDWHMVSTSLIHLMLLQSLSLAFSGMRWEMRLCWIFSIISTGFTARLDVRHNVQSESWPTNQEHRANSINLKEYLEKLIQLYRQINWKKRLKSLTFWKFLGHR